MFHIWYDGLTIHVCAELGAKYRKRGLEWREYSRLVEMHARRQLHVVALLHKAQAKLMLSSSTWT